MNSVRYLPTFLSCPTCKEHFGYIETDYDTFKVNEAATHDELESKETVVATINKRNPELERVISSSKSSRATSANIPIGLPRKNVSPFRYEGTQI